jgi:hypothetical protein
MHGGGSSGGSGWVQEEWGLMDKFSLVSEVSTAPVCFGDSFFLVLGIYSKISLFPQYT